MNVYRYCDSDEADRKAIALRRDGEMAWTESTDGCAFLVTSARLFGRELLDHPRVGGF